MRVFLVTLVLVALPGAAQDFGVDWWSIDWGGEVFSETADQHWQLSSTLGQWDSWEAVEPRGSGWTLSGGFWPATVDETDQLFSDGVEP